MFELKSSLADNGVLVIELRHNSLDASNVRAFREAVQPLLQGFGNRVVIDMAAVGFIDSSGLGALISCLRTLNEQKGDLRLCNMSTTVQALFELMRMHHVFTIFNTRESAVRSF